MALWNWSRLLIFLHVFQPNAEKHVLLIHNFIFTVRNVVAERLCFHRRLSFCSQGWCIPACTGTDTIPPPGRHIPGRHPSPRRPLQRTVRIILECILVAAKFNATCQTISSKWFHIFTVTFQNDPDGFFSKSELKFSHFKGFICNSILFTGLGDFFT